MENGGCWVSIRGKMDTGDSLRRMMPLLVMTHMKSSKSDEGIRKVSFRMFRKHNNASLIIGNVRATSPMKFDSNVKDTT